MAPNTKRQKNQVIFIPCKVNKNNLQDIDPNQPAAWKVQNLHTGKLNSPVPYTASSNSFHHSQFSCFFLFLSPVPWEKKN